MKWANLERRIGGRLKWDLFVFPSFKWRIFMSKKEEKDGKWERVNYESICYYVTEPD